MSVPSAAADTFHERYIPALDGIRGIAILIVLLHHFRFLLNAQFRTQYILFKCFEVGWCGVVLFFVLSGFLITGILLDSRSSTNYFSTFYARRVLRIFPLYYGYLALAFLGSRLLHNLFGGVNPLLHINPWLYMSYFENYRKPPMIVDPYLGHLWSLAVEEQFYLIWPLLVFLVRPAALAWICLALIPLSLGVRFHYAGQSPGFSAYVNTITPASLDSLASGALIALTVRSIVWRRRVALVAPYVIAISLIWFSILAWRSGGLFEYEYLIQTWGITALTLLFAAFVFIAATSRRGVVVSLLNLSGLRFTGKISYGLYVLHPLVYALVLQVLAAVPVPGGLDLALNSEKIVLITMASMVVAVGSWNYFERPILGLKKFFRYQTTVAESSMARSGGNASGVGASG
jgi:peptidoglycan/LPS O-acetylase OafA/YrhL